MIHRTTIASAIFVIMFFGQSLRAQHDILKGDSIVFVEKTLKKFSKNVNFTVVPGPIYNTTQKLGFVILPMLVYDLNRKDTISPPSSTGVMLYATIHGSWMVALKQNLYWNQDRWRAAFNIGGGSMHMRFFGVGRDTVVIDNSDTNYVWSRLKGFYGNMTCYRMIFRHFFGGLQYNFGRSEFRGDDSTANAYLISEGMPEGQETQSVLIPTFIWDSRDNIYWSLKGYYATLNLQFANGIIFSSYEYTLLGGQVNGYHRLMPPSNKLSLAWHFFFQAGRGDLPYEKMASYGKGDDATGYTGGKYVNISECSAQLELRYELWKFIAVSGYGGTGKVYSSMNTFGQSVWLHFGGARVYVNVMPSRNLRLRVDLAVARKDWGVYVGIGQAF